ncbi:hypothetical protein [Halogeometricum pallidum]|nr:hypothetical protein [Halogeometricum pallidum]
MPASSTHLLVTVRWESRIRDRAEQFVVLNEDTLREWLKPAE